MNNTSPVGVIAAVFQHFEMNGYVNMINNYGPGLRVREGGGCLLNVSAIVHMDVCTLIWRLLSVPGLRH